MIKVNISLLMMLITVNTSWGEEESYLEGISILGAKKIAYLSIMGNKIPILEGETLPFGEGEAVETWQVVRIERKSVVLLKMNDGLVEELRLDSRLPVPATKEAEVDLLQPLPDEIVATSPTNPKNEVLPGYRTVRTPFGSFTVRDDTYPLPLNQPSPTKPTIAETEVPPGHHVVQTPFGDFIVKDQE